MIGVVPPAEPKSPDEYFGIHQKLMMVELSLRLEQGYELSYMPSAKHGRLIVFALPMKPYVIH